MDYLDQIAYEPGEFAQTQRGLDRLLELLSAELQPTIERGLAAQLSAATVETWAGVARSSLQHLLDDQLLAADSGEDAALAESELAAAAMSRLPLDLPVPADKIRAEAASCARELAHLLLAQWLRPLTDATVGDARGLPLNGNMLPGQLTVADATSAVPCAAYGLDWAFVLQAVHRFQNGLVTAAAGAPIVLGPRIQVVAVPTDLDRPYRLFHDEARAAAFLDSLNAAPAPRPLSARELRNRWMELARTVQSACWPDVPEDDKCVWLADTALSLTCQAQTGSPAMYRYGRLVSRLPFVREDQPERLLLDCAAMGTDRLVGGLGVSLNEAGNQLCHRAPAIRAALVRYAKARHVPLSMANDVFTVVVLIGAGRGTGAVEILVTPDMINRGSAAFEQLLQQHGVERDTQAAELLDDSQLGAMFFGRS